MSVWWSSSRASSRQRQCNHVAHQRRPLGQGPAHGGAHGRQASSASDEDKGSASQGKPQQNAVVRASASRRQPHARQAAAAAAAAAAAQQDAQSCERASASSRQPHAVSLTPSASRKTSRTAAAAGRAVVRACVSLTQGKPRQNSSSS